MGEYQKWRLSVWNWVNYDIVKKGPLNLRWTLTPLLEPLRPLPKVPPMMDWYIGGWPFWKCINLSLGWEFSGPITFLLQKGAVKNKPVKQKKRNLKSRWRTTCTQSPREEVQATTQKMLFSTTVNALAWFVWKKWGKNWNPENCWFGTISITIV